MPIIVNAPKVSEIKLLRPMENPMKKHRFTVLIERDKDGYLVAMVPALKSCYTQAMTMEELMPRIKEVIELCLQEEEPVPMSFEAVQQIEIMA
jgi:predicted RNase H-like HicB family nuclease